MVSIGCIAAIGIAGLNTSSYQNTYPIYSAQPKHNVYISPDNVTASAEISTVTTSHRPAKSEGNVNGGPESALPSLPLNLNDDLESLDALFSEQDELIAVMETESSQYITTIEKGDSLIGALRGAGLDSTAVTQLIYGSNIESSVFNVRVGDTITVSGPRDSVALAKPSGVHSFELDNDKWRHAFDEHEVVPRKYAISFDVSRSFYSDALSAGMTPNEIANFQSVFKHAIDFGRLRAGEKFNVLVKRSYQNGQLQSGSRILALEGRVAGRDLMAYRYESGKVAGYYYESGESVVPSFREHPVKHVRVTSPFDMYRKHPVLNTVRPHRGTDYGGAGQPIYAIGDGVVVFAGPRGSYGNTVIIDHGDGIRTLSAHQHRFEPGIRKGVKVKRDQVIGYVGSTGIVTGPHLHFELQVNGQHVDFLNYPLPTLQRVEDKGNFSKVANRYSELLRDESLLAQVNADFEVKG